MRLSQTCSSYILTRASWKPVPCSAIRVLWHPTKRRHARPAGRRHREEELLTRRIANGAGRDALGNSEPLMKFTLISLCCWNRVAPFVHGRSHCGLEEPRGTRIVRYASFVRDMTVWSVMPW